MKYFSYLNTAVSIIKAYSGEIPFNLFIKNFFSANKKYGSKDRKQIAGLCYNYFRLGHSVSQLDREEKIITGAFLCEENHSAFLQAVRPEWNEKILLSLAEKIIIVNNDFTIDSIFPWRDELSENVDPTSFSVSFLKQPLLYLRTRPGKEIIVKEKLTHAGLQFDQPYANCISLPNNSKVTELILVDKEAVVQDLNSQKIGEFIQLAVDEIPSEISAWDCCAASGGKSILLHDLAAGKLDLTVSDIRPSIINNLKERFKRAGVKNYKSFIADLSLADRRLPTARYDFILCDAPCTGSGTWARTPENLCFFEKEKIEYYASLQKKILNNSIPLLAESGYFIYITCSVFKKENEEAVKFIKNEFKLELVNMELLKGYDKEADSMFAALFKKPGH